MFHHFLMKMIFLTAILDLGGHLRFVLLMNHTCLKFSIISYYYVNFHYIILQNLAAIAILILNSEDGGHLGFLRPYWFLKRWCILYIKILFKWPHFIYNAWFMLGYQFFNLKNTYVGHLGFWRPYRIRNSCFPGFL